MDDLTAKPNSRLQRTCLAALQLLDAANALRGVCALGVVRARDLQFMASQLEAMASRMERKVGAALQGDTQARAQAVATRQALQETLQAVVDLEDTHATPRA